MKKRDYRIGDMVMVTAYTPGHYAPGVKDEMGTEELFKSMVGKSYRVYGIDEYGYLELRPTRFDTVWIGQQDVRLRHKRTKRNGTAKR